MHEIKSPPPLGAKTWEQSMEQWASIWEKVYSTDMIVSASGRMDMLKQYENKSRADPQYDYHQRINRLIKYANRHISKTYPAMKGYVHSDVIEFITAFCDLTLKYYVESKNMSEQLLIHTESELIHMYPRQIDDIVRVHNRRVDVDGIIAP